MKRTILCLLLALLFIIPAGCSKKQEGQEIEEFIKEYYLNSFPNSYKEEDKVLVLDCIENDNGGYVLVHYAGEGPDMYLYKYEKNETGFNVTQKCQGEMTGSGLFSINLICEDGKYIYFGQFSVSHWEPSTDVRTYIDVKEITFKDSSGKAVTKDLTDKGGYICILDSKFKDFQVIDSSGNVALDYATYKRQEYPIYNCEYME